MLVSKSVEGAAEEDPSGPTMNGESQSCKKRSGFALLCSGPAPSIPCGSNKVKPVWRNHLASPEAMNWSTTTCAVLKKSPNCASQSTKFLGCSMEYPYSKAMTPSSD